jgi:hypothetical protein
MEDKLIMKDATKRSILRSIHFVFSIPILGYIYSPFEEIPKYAARVRFVVRSCNAPFGILEVGRPCPSTTYFEEITEENYSHENGTGIGGIKIQ